MIFILFKTFTIFLYKYPMIYLLNDIKFGNPKLSKFQIEYFDNYFIPLLLKMPPSKIILCGDLFYNTKHVTFNLISKVINILKELSIVPIEIVGNDYCLNIIKDHVNQIPTIDYDTKNISLFQHTKDDTNEIGFYAIKDKQIIVHNKITPKFLQYNINQIEDLDTVEITKDFIDLNINSEILENQQNKNKIDLFLNNNPLINVYYSEKFVVDDKVTLDSKNINIRNILVNNIDESLKVELNEIFTLYDEKKNKIIC